MRILGFGTYDVSRHPRAEIVLDGFRACGDEVVEVNEPLGFSTAERVLMLQRPWLVVRLAVRLLICWLHLARRSIRARRAGRYDAVFVGYLGHFDVVLARLLFPRSPIVLDFLVSAADTSRDRGMAGRVRVGLLEVLDRLAAGCADVVVLDTAAQFVLLTARARRKAVVVPVGAPQSWFDAGVRPSRSAAGGLKVIFFGLFTPLQGAPVIGEALALLVDRPDISVTMIGNGQDYALTRELAGDRPATTWIDWVDPTQLPSVVAAHDVCLGIFGTTAKASRVVPNKVFQGAAAGCAIVTSGSGVQKDLLGDAAHFVPAGDAGALAQTLRMFADRRELVEQSGRRSREVALQRFTPRQVVVPLRERLIARDAHNVK